MKLRLIACVGILGLLTAAPVSAQNFQDGADWIAHWYALHLVTNTGGFGPSALVDYISDGTGGDLTHETLSTIDGVRQIENMVVDLPDNGGALEWEIVEIDITSSRNISTTWGLADETNVTWHSVAVVISPSKQDVTAHPAHDDHAQIWLNGELVYDNSQWTGGAQIVTTPTDFPFERGENVLLFKCGESGGDDYINLHFDDAGLEVAPTTDGKFFEVTSLAVDPAGKMETTWGELKAR